MATSSNVQDVDFQHEADRRNIQSLDDVTLVYVMLGLNGEVEGAPGWARTPRARTIARIVFSEIALRWIPPQVFGDAFRRLTEEEGGDDA